MGIRKYTECMECIPRGVPMFEHLLTEYSNFDLKHYKNNQKLKKILTIFVSSFFFVHFSPQEQTIIPKIPYLKI